MHDTRILGAGIKVGLFKRRGESSGGPQLHGTLVEAIDTAVTQYRRWFHTGDLNAIWESRERLELRWAAEGPNGKDAFDRFSAACGASLFWVDAFPAFAGLHMGHGQESRVFQYAGNADAHVDRNDREQATMMAAIDDKARAAFRSAHPSPGPMDAGANPRALLEREIDLAHFDNDNRLVAYPMNDGWISYLVWGDGAPDYQTNPSALTSEIYDSAPTWDLLLDHTARHIRGSGPIWMRADLANKSRNL
jgi:hypothetical protein